MANLRAALVQTTWTGDKETMIKAHEEYARQAAEQGAKVICFQELFYGPYFCQVQDAAYYEYAESIPGPTTERFQALARELEMVMVLPMYEQEQPGVLYNTAAVVDADGSYLGKYRKTHIPQVKGFWEKFYFRPEVFDRVAEILPGRWRTLYRLTDPIGSWNRAPDGQRDESYVAGETRVRDLAEVDQEVADPRLPGGGPMRGHSDYWLDPVYTATVARLAALK